MNREILFKAKLKDWKTNPEHNRWIEGFYLNRKETTYCFKDDYEKYPVKTLHFIAEEHMTDWGLPNTFGLYEIDPDTLCQYTGIDDKKDNKIWENDIVKAYNDVYTVKWNELSFRYELKSDGFDCELGHFFDDELKVIGNIFDNKEILEGGNEQ